MTDAGPGGAPGPERHALTFVLVLTAVVIVFAIAVAVWLYALQPASPS